MVQAAIEGMSLLPVEVVQALATSCPLGDYGAGLDQSQATGELSADEIRWLRELLRPA